ncbi:MAG: hypothetical protein IKP00_01680 [Victivallales bacterium]|nr:hypothetical protein [Victivallales bacterium]
MSEAFFISDGGVAASPEELVRHLLGRMDCTQKCSVRKAPYLELAEKIVRAAVSWQDEVSGRIIDPYEHVETPTATARYVGALGALLQQGRCKDLADSCIKAMTPVLEDLYYVRTNHGEFLVKEAMMAYMALKDSVRPELLREWEHYFADYDPEKTYGRTKSTTPDIAERQNYLTFSLAGEALKKHHCLADNQVFVQAYLAEQLGKFDEWGMYRDPHCPIVYDITPRMNLEIAEHYASYHEPYASMLRKDLWNGAMCMLLYQSPTGEMPFGGRSNQQNFVEASFAVICELEARRCRDNGDMLLAGVFRRAAARAVHSIEKYLQETPINFNKNRFPPSVQHGRQRSYGYYGAYSLLIASQLALASLFADDAIPFANSSPAETGTYLWRTTDDFHKLFACVQGNHVEVELMPDMNYDALGWGRWHLMGAPAELALSCPVTAHPSFLTITPPSEALAFGPGIPDGFVAGMSIEKSSECKVHSISVNDSAVEFSVDWPCFGARITETLRLEAGSVHIEAVNHSADVIYYRVPMILTDGENWGTVETLDNGFTLHYKGCSFMATCENHEFEKLQETWIAANRNALYRPICFKVNSRSIKLDFRIVTARN